VTTPAGGSLAIRQEIGPMVIRVASFKTMKEVIVVVNSFRDGTRDTGLFTTNRNVIARDSPRFKSLLFTCTPASP
jgi:hypothetical protein